MMKNAPNICRIEWSRQMNLFSICVTAFYLLYAIGLPLLLPGKGTTLLFEKIVNDHFSTLPFSVFPLIFIVNTSREFTLGYTAKLLCNGYTRRSYYHSKLLLILLHAAFCAALYFIVSIVCYHAASPSFQLYSASLPVKVMQVFFTSCYFLLIAFTITLICRNLRDGIAVFILCLFVENVIAEIFKTYTWPSWLPFQTGRVFYERMPDWEWVYFCRMGVYGVLVGSVGVRVFRSAAL